MKSVTCTECRETVQKSAAREWAGGDNFICDECYDEDIELSTCDECDKFMHRSDMYKTGGEMYCDACWLTMIEEAMEEHVITWESYKEDGETIEQYREYAKACVDHLPRNLRLAVYEEIDNT